MYLLAIKEFRDYLKSHTRHNTRQNPTKRRTQIVTNNPENKSVKKNLQSLKKKRHIVTGCNIRDNSDEDNAHI
jgi:hypothetical protein